MFVFNKLERINVNYKDLGITMKPLLFGALLSLTVLQVNAEQTIGLPPTNLLGDAGVQDKPEPIMNAWKMPQFTFPDTNGEMKTLKDWKGKVIMLNFWATWCGPCATEIPHFIKYQQKYADKGLQIVGVALDKTRPVKNFVKSLGINYPVLIANPVYNTSLLNIWGDSDQVLPYTVVINRDGHFNFMQVGILDEEAFADFVEPLLK